jgi:hypothetical protein
MWQKVKCGRKLVHTVEKQTTMGQENGRAPEGNVEKGQQLELVSPEQEAPV